VAQWVWYAEESGIECADRFLAAVDATLRRVAEHPRSGRLLEPALHPKLPIRVVPVGSGFQSILLFYLASEDGVELIRVIHGSRDLAVLLDEFNQD
jgi:toxin ParE1/3/4